MDLVTKLEAVLFATAKPLSYKRLAKVLDISEEVMLEALGALKERRNIPASGIHVLDQNGGVQLVTNAECEPVLRQFVKNDLASDLTRPALETLTIIAYRGPVTKPEIEQIRGVNCSLILRNLLIRDMVIEKMNEQKLQPEYSVSHNFLRHLGLKSVEDLPSYEEFAGNEEIANLIQDMKDEA